MARGRKFIPNVNQIPLFTPESPWKVKPPSEWPDFRAHAKIIGVDTETHDPDLITRGSGFVRNNAKLVGVSLASEDGQKLYLPLRHSEGNVEDVSQALSYIKYQLGGDQEKCGANLTYDLESLWSEGIDLNGDLADIQTCEPILDEDRPGGYSLESLGRDYLGVGKNEQLLKEAGAAYGADPKTIMHLLPAKYVGLYAEDDADLPIHIYLKQKELLKNDDCWDIFELERRLQKTLFKMRLRGIRVDVEQAAELTTKFKLEEEQLYSNIQSAGNGSRINPSSSDDIGRVFEHQGIYVPRTEAGNFSITNEWLQEQTGDLASNLFEWRKTNKMRKDFIEKISDEAYNGRIFTNWHALREFDEESRKSKGTRSGRIASSKINMTQVPSRDPKWGKMIRKLFIADRDGIWVKADYSQQEPRHTVHYAYIMGYPGAAEARQRYIDDPSTDYHQMVADLIEEKTGRSIGRRTAKDINLGSAYGMGKDKLSRKLGIDVDTATEILKVYHEGVPFVKKLEQATMKAAERRGYIITILGRKRRFPAWEPAEFGVYGIPTRDREKALEYWGKIRRADVRKALNALIQGSAADQTKKALIMLDDEGLLPQIQVYDEINGTYANDNEARRVQYIMEHAIESTVPFLAKPDVGTSWGDVEELKDAA